MPNKAESTQRYYLEDLVHYKRDCMDISPRHGIDIAEVRACDTDAVLECKKICHLAPERIKNIRSKRQAAAKLRFLKEIGVEFTCQGREQA